MFRSYIQAEPFDAAAEQEKLQALGSNVGAIVSFIGQVREEALFLEHYPAMADRQLQELVEEARSRFPLIGATIIHRYGLIAVGAPIVLVVTASSHRKAAFEAAEYMMDWLKTHAPFWKKDTNGWVEAKASDDEAATRWIKD